MTDEQGSVALRCAPRFGPDWPPAARWGVLGLAALCVVLLAGVIYYAVMLLFFKPSSEGYRDTALASARQAATDFSTYDYRNADADFARLHDHATGAFRGQVEDAQKQLVPLLKQGKATAQGQVRDSAIIAAKPSQVRVIAVVDESVTNTSIPDGAIRRYRFLLVMSKVSGQWLVSDLQQA